MAGSHLALQGTFEGCVGVGRQCLWWESVPQSELVVQCSLKFPVFTEKWTFLMSYSEIKCPCHTVNQMLAVTLLSYFEWKCLCPIVNWNFIVNWIFLIILLTNVSLYYAYENVPVMLTDISLPCSLPNTSYNQNFLFDSWGWMDMPLLLPTMATCCFIQISGLLWVGTIVKFWCCALIMSVDACYYGMFDEGKKQCWDSGIRGRMTCHNKALVLGEQGWSSPWIHGF